MILKENIPISKTSLKVIRGLCARHGVDTRGINIVRNTGLTWQGAVACFSVMTPNTIYLCHDQKNLISLIPFIGHEVKHRDQYLRNRAVYLIRANPLWRKWTIEPEAYKEEERIQEEINGK